MRFGHIARARSGPAARTPQLLQALRADSYYSGKPREQKLSINPFRKLGEQGPGQLGKAGTPVGMSEVRLLG